MVESVVLGLKQGITFEKLRAGLAPLGYSGAEIDEIMSEALKRFGKAPLARLPPAERALEEPTRPVERPPVPSPEVYAPAREVRAAQLLPVRSAPMDEFREGGKDSPLLLAIVVAMFLVIVTLVVVLVSRFV